MTPLQAYTIDNKMDNGAPHSGMVMGDHGVGDSMDCHTVAQYADNWVQATHGEPEYEFALDNDRVCRMMFVLE